MHFPYLTGKKIFEQLVLPNGSYCLFLSFNVKFHATIQGTDVLILLVIWITVWIQQEYFIIVKENAIFRVLFCYFCQVKFLKGCFAFCKKSSIVCALCINFFFNLTQ